MARQLYLFVNITARIYMNIFSYYVSPKTVSGRKKSGWKMWQKTPIFKIKCGEHLQDGGGLGREDYLPPHKYIKNTSTCGRTPTEHLLNLRPPKRQENPHVPR